MYWGTTKYKYEITDTVFTIKSSVNGQTLYDLDYTLSEDGTTLTIGSPISGIYTKL